MQGDRGARSTSTARAIRAPIRLGATEDVLEAYALDSGGGDLLAHPWARLRARRVDAGGAEARRRDHAPAGARAVREERERRPALALPVDRGDPRHPGPHLRR